MTWNNILRRFGLKPLPQWVERRAWISFPDPAKAGRPATPREDATGLLAKVLGLSPEGLRLGFNRELELGTQLEVELISDLSEASEPWLVTVKRASTQEDGLWLLDCDFARRISQAEVEALRS